MNAFSTSPFAANVDGSITLCILDIWVRAPLQQVFYAIMMNTRLCVLAGKEKRSSAKRILKVLHYFSHGNRIDRLAGNNELIFDVEHAVSDLLSAIEERDELHWNALMLAVTD